MNPRHYSQIERALQILDKSGTVEILKDDQYLLFLLKKTERIVAALYVVTGLFPDVEPLKWGIRECGTSVIRNVLSFKERSMVHSKEFLSDTFVEIAHLLSLLDLAYVADLLSPMNFSVVKKELEIVIGIIEGKWRVAGSLSSSPFLDESFFGVSKEMFSEPREKKSDHLHSASSEGEQRSEQKVTLSSFGEFERLKKNQKDTYEGHDETEENVPQREAPIFTSNARATVVRKVAVRPVLDHVREDRRKSILKVLGQKGSAMIKDFSAVIVGCSEKTIQRLLIDLVQEGVLKKKGDRRWSRYSIVS